MPKPKTPASWTETRTRWGLVSGVVLLKIRLGDSKAWYLEAVPDVKLDPWELYESLGIVLEAIDEEERCGKA